MDRRIAFSIGLTLLFASPLSAQSRDSVSFDATIGTSVGSGGRRNYYSEGDIAGELTLTYRPHPDRETSWIAGVTVGGRSRFGFGDKCFLELPTGSVCRPAFPALAHFGLLGGVERQGAGFAVRALAGPAFYHGKDASGAGGQFHVDGAVGFTHLAFVAAARGSLVAMFTGEMLRARSLEFGLRLQ